MNEILLGDTVQISLNGKLGTVKAKCEWVGKPTQYNLYYVNGAGDAIYEWFEAFDIVKVV